MLLSFSLRNYRHYASVSAALVEVNHAVYQCVESVILTDTYVISRVVSCTTLANDDVAGDNLLTTPNLNA